MRLDELSRLKVEDIDFDQNVAYVLGEGRRPRACPFGNKTSQALDRYLRQRNRQKRAELPHLRLGVNGRPQMTDNGVGQMLHRYGASAAGTRAREAHERLMLGHRT